ncbi:MAG: Glu/Leu/Phe/Val dehydrogenase [Gammaproteobacteria bacterium]|nr:Glu/Leu/Phe/Val dehydrogenase [Gammaproteobacteria bacterium]
MSIFNHPDFDNHEQVVFFSDPETGLKAIVSIHDTTLGPGVGGCRMWQYSSDEQALTDVLRLSRGMTYKNAMAGLNFGGGKSVIIGDSHSMKSDALFKAFGRCLNRLSGHYISAEDVGITTADMAIMNTESDFVAGLEGKSGDPSPFTAYGVYKGMKAAIKHKLNINSLAGLKVSVQGVGHVGYYLCKHLHEEGAELVVTDINQQSIDKVVEKFSAKVVEPEAIYDQEVDIYAPCALGATLNDDTIDRLKCSIIAGAANNQLAKDHHGQVLMNKGILYVPDYIVNAGGIINISFEENYQQEAAYNKIDEIYGTLMEVFKTSSKENKPTNLIADHLARERITKVKNKG